MKLMEGKELYKMPMCFIDGRFECLPAIRHLSCTDQHFKEVELETVSAQGCIALLLEITWYENIDFFHSVIV